VMIGRGWGGKERDVFSALGLCLVVRSKEKRKKKESQRTKITYNCFLLFLVLLFLPSFIVPPFLYPGWRVGTRNERENIKKTKIRKNET